MYVKTNGYVDGFINESFFEPTLALILTPIIVLLALSVTKLQYLELNDESIIYYRGNSLMESLKMVAEQLRSCASRIILAILYQKQILIHIIYR